MGDETVFGPELHRLGFGDAVEADLLTDYKVLVLSVDESYVAEHFQSAMAQSGEIALGDAAKLIGCWNGLRKHFGPADLVGDDGCTPMRRSGRLRQGHQGLQAGLRVVPRDGATGPGRTRPTSGRTSASRLRTSTARWASTSATPTSPGSRADARDDTCRVLTNARCLSEGVDVPALDAVLFLTPARLAGRRRPVRRAV